ncbi:MAG: cation-translocating P-type ATPase [Deltaproteobacteria bacterium]|nr:cation-translocating P-type ATPase [Deltaproteobacteria bacterium]
MDEVTLSVKGLDCEDEARLIRGALDGVTGVKGYEINIMARRVKVSFDTEAISVQDILMVIKKTGMEASQFKAVGATGRSPMRSRTWWMEPRILTLSICGILILLTFILEHILGLIHGKAAFLYGAATVIGGYYPAKMGLTALKTLTPNIRTLMVAGALGAISLGLWEEAALLVLIYSLGDVLEAYAADRVRNAVRALLGLAPKEALVKRDGREIVLPLDDVRVGDTLIIKPGDRIPLDGVIITGSSSVDQAPITGESIPVSKGLGDDVFAGSINQRGSLEIRTTKPFEDTTLGRIIHYVEEAEARKSSYQRFGETFGRYYTPSMFVLSLGVMLVPALLVGGFQEWFYRGLVVLVVSCSCGIALSIPVAVVAAISNAARHGVLIKGGAHLEAASRIRAIAFDKTGSLTIGKPVVTDIIPFGNVTEDDILKLSASIESRSEHILADAILSKAKEKGIPVNELEGFEAIPGLGAKAVINGKTHCIGSMALCSRLGVLTSEAEAKIKNLEGQGKTVIVLTGERSLMGIIAVRDELRPEAKDVLKRLKEMGIRANIMLTGDNEQVASVVSNEAGIDRYMFQLLPEEKVDAVRALKEEFGLVGMVGDGVNDAPAMVTSDLGIAMGAAGTDVAIETGDIVLMSDDLSKLPYVIDLSKRTVNNIKQNIRLSLIVIAFLVPMALAGLIGLVPGLLINEVGGLLVIINGLRLLR